MTPADIAESRLRFAWVMGWSIAEVDRFCAICAEGGPTLPEASS